MIAPIDSTADLGAGSDSPPNANDDSQPVPSEVQDTTDTPLTLTADQVQAAGIGSLQPGDQFTVQIKGTVTDSEDDTITADIDSVESMPDDKEAMPAKKAKGDIGGKILSPEAAGFGTVTPGAP